MPQPAALSTLDAACLHCGLPVPSGSDDGYCCAGCRVVHELIAREDLGRYYELRGGSGQPAAAAAATTRRDRKWLEPIEARLASATGPTRVALDLQGIHCAGCVWLVEELFRKHAGGVQCVVNPTLGSVQIVATAAFPLRAFVEHVESFGYLLGPALKDRAASRPDDLLLRMGVCIAIAMNSMIFAIPTYAGLREGPVFRWFHAINFALSVLAVRVGGPVFIRSAWRALRRGIAHVDQPIALGIITAFASSAHAFFTRGGSSAYFDTLDVFIALMLVGRWLQERVVEHNRRWLLDTDGVEGLRTRRLDGADVTTIACTEVRAGDRLLLAPGDLVPVAATLEEEGASFSLDWINGESAPVLHERGAQVAAGSFLAGSRAATVRADEPFAASTLVELLRSPTARDDASRSTPWWRSFARVYVGAVLVAATGGAMVGWARTHALGPTLDVVTAVLILTCPCAFGIATPLAYELVLAGLRRAGLFVRAPGFLDRATAVRQVVFDKTGTLTTGELRVADPRVLATLDATARTALFNLVARSTHPKSVAVKRALERRGAPYVPAFEADETPGKGLSARWDDREWRLGSPAWVGVEDDADLVFAANGAFLCAIRTEEDVRPDAAAEIRALTASGLAVRVLTGDLRPRAEAVAAACGIAAHDVEAERSPEGKAAWARANDPAHTLMVGDGINDSLVVDEALCSGTPAIDRPFMAARSDFYFITPGLRPVRLALRAARTLARVVRRNLAVAVTYNVLAVGLAWAGLMSPLLCAVLMPLSSLSIVLATVASLSERSPLWKS